MCFFFSPFYEGGFRFDESVHERLSWILRKTLILDHKVMQVVTEVVCTRSASMPIIHPKKRAFWPIIAVFVLRLHYIQYDGHSIFIVVPYNPLVRVCSISAYNPVTLRGALCRLVFGKEDLSRINIHRSSQKVTCVLKAKRRTQTHL